MDQSLRILVVGGVAGGASAATRARRCNEAAEITILEKDGYVSFANCGLPYYLGGDITDREKLLVAKPSLFEQRFRIDIRVHHEVTRIVPLDKRVEGFNRATGESFSLPYDKLILAPGAAPVVPDLPGARAANVFALRNVEDTDVIKAFLDSRAPKRAVVVGAGFIGLEMVEQFHQLGMAVSVVELAPQVLAPLDPEMAAIVEKELRKQGVGVHLGSGLRGFEVADNRVSAVFLENGAALPADMVILGMGVRPSTELAKVAGLAIGPMGGIVINDVAQTSDPDIYAAGDVVEYPDTFVGNPMRVPKPGPWEGYRAPQSSASFPASPHRPA